MSLLNLRLVCFIILLYSSYVSCRWCTRLKSETQVQTYTEFGECQQSYHAACGWLTRKQCTYYETVPCPVERNKTVVQYRIVTECCRGYKLDPINNITCIWKPEEAKSDGVLYYDSDEGLLFGLSHGAYAGIVCSFLFVVCVVVLVILHGIKRRRRSIQAKESKDLEVEVSEKFIQATKV